MPLSGVDGVFENLDEQLLKNHSPERGYALALLWGGNRAQARAGLVVLGRRSEWLAAPA